MWCAFNASPVLVDTSVKCKSIRRSKCSGGTLEYYAPAVLSTDMKMKSRGHGQNVGAPGCGLYIMMECCGHEEETNGTSHC